METEIDVVIPTCKPGEEFLGLLEALAGQTLAPGRIIIMNTEEKYFERLKYGRANFDAYQNVEVHHLSTREFDHGNTRNKGIKKSHAPYFVCMTQDAIPADEFLLEKLLEPLLAGKAQVSYARQLPKGDCRPAERFTKEFNYPEQSESRGKRTLQSLASRPFFVLMPVQPMSGRPLISWADLHAGQFLMKI